MKKKKLTRLSKFIIFVFFITIFGYVLYRSVLFLSPDKKVSYITSKSNQVILYNSGHKEVDKIFRGEKVILLKKNADDKYSKISYNSKDYYILKDNLVDDYSLVVSEKEMFVRTSLTVYKDKNGSLIEGFLKKGSQVEITNFYDIKEGNPTIYKINYNNGIGYIYAKYLTDTIDKANAYYNTVGINKNALSLDYYPYPKITFEDNKMPEEVKAIYLNGGVLDDIDKYIEIAKTSSINAFVIDIKENTFPTYKSEVMKEYTISSYNKASRNIDNMKAIIKKIHDNNIYVIGRIVVAKDTFFANDNPDEVIWDTSTNSKYLHNGSVWVSMFSRKVWEYNVNLAIEAVKKVGFNEIQFDYLRFPDSSRTDLNFRNNYDESKSEAIQNFLFYATDAIHKHNAYVAADVFGESAHGYITTYGQYWAAISNVVDVISGMPYPELFASGEYGIVKPWNEPYNTLYNWGKYVLKQQALIETPAIVRTWIEAYTPRWRKDYIEYTDKEVSEEIKALYSLGFTNGFIAWNGSSSKEAYISYKEAFKKEY